MVNDHLSDFVTRVRNGYRAGLAEIDAPDFRIIEKTADVLVKTGYAEKISKRDNKLIVTLKYVNKKSVIMGIRRVSKPGARIYTGIKDLPKVWGGLGINILSTPKGVMGEKEAKKLKTGGEIIAQVW